MANGAGLLAASRGLMDLAGLSNQAFKNIREQKLEDEDRAKQDQLFQMQLAKGKREQKSQDLDIQKKEDAASRRKKALELTAKIEGTIAAERIKRKQKAVLDSAIDKMTPQQLDVEYGARNPEEAKQLAYTEIELPTGETDEQIIERFKPEIQTLQFASPEVQGLQSGITQRRKRSEQLRDVESQRQFKAEERQAAQQFRTREREAGQDFAASQKALDRASREAINAANAARTRTKPPSSDAFKAATFGLRVQQAENTFKDLEGKGFDPTTIKNRVVQKGNISAIKDPQQRQYAQALRNFINATLRRESGAAISEGEFDSAIKQYFPQLGDDPQTLDQRKRNRQAVQAGLVAEAGPAFGMVKEKFEQISGEPTAGQGKFKPITVGRYTVEIEEE